jgi:hypothetical protein
MKITASILIAAAAIAPAVAYGFEGEDSLVTRDDNEFASAYGRGLDLDLDEREFDEELYEREPWGRGIVRGARKMFRGGSRQRNGVSAPSTPTPETQSERREFDDDLLEREFEEELYERELWGRGMVRGAKKMFRGERRPRPSVSSSNTPTFETQSGRREFDDELMEREFNDELMEREYDDELMEREYDDELFGREYDSELFEREPEPFFGFLKRLFNKKKAPAPDAEVATIDARDFDELD